MSVKDKLAQVLALIEKHNAQVEDQSDKVNADEFQRKLKKLGGTTEEALAECKWEDIENCGLPRILARKAAEIFRAQANLAPTGISPRTAEKMSIIYLLQDYDPSDADSVVARELKKRSYGKRFVVISASGKVHIEKSAQMFTEVVLKHFEEREIVTVDDETYRVYPIGEGKTELFDESPIFVGRILRPDGTDDQLNRSWEGVPTEVRQFIRIAVMEGELKPTQDNAHNVLDVAIGDKPMDKLKKRFSKASVRFNELKEQGDLPKLKLTRVGTPRVTKQDPFYGGSSHKTF